MTSSRRQCTVAAILPESESESESDFFRPRGLSFTPLRRPRGYVGTKTIYISILTDLLVLSNGLILSNEDLELPVILTISLNLRSSFYRDL
jgi:hypothetical protein